MTERSKGILAGVGTLVLALSGFVGSVAEAAPATGAGSYQIVGGTILPRTVQTAFEASGCSSQVSDGALNGTDGIIVNVAGIAAKPGAKVNLAWSALTPGQGFAWGEVRMYTASCSRVPSEPATLVGVSSTRTLTAATKWLVFSPSISAGVTLVVTDVTP